MSTSVETVPSDRMIAALRKLRARRPELLATYVESPGRMIVEDPRTRTLVVIDGEGYVDPDRVYSFRTRYFEDGASL